MTELEKKIYNVISSRDGLKGKDIAQIINEDKQTVNSALFRSAVLKALVKQDNNYRWHLIQQTKDPVSINNVPKADVDLQKLCRYYLNCLSQEEGSSVSTWLTSKYNPNYAVLETLGIDSNASSDVLQLLRRVSGNKDMRAYLGYPVRIYSFTSKTGNICRKIAPVFLYPVDTSGGSAEITWTPSINMEVIKAYSEGSNETAASELVALETELGMANPDVDADPEEIVLRLKDIRAWDWAEEMDPYNIPEIESLENLKDGIYNRPIIITAEKEKYTVGLESELMALAQMPSENFKDTALYAWVKNQPLNLPASKIKPLLEVLPLNTEQAIAVENALVSELTIITGPPGTGKSQVVTDLLVNVAWNGQSALFSSKNNKAVDVVESRVNGLCKRPILLRLGGTGNAVRLADNVDGLLNAKVTDSNKADVDYYEQAYQKKNAEMQRLKNQKDALVQQRNNLERLEEQFDVYRAIIDDCKEKLESADIGKIKGSAERYATACHRAEKTEQGFFARLFWPCISEKRQSAKTSAEKAYNSYAHKYGLTVANNETPSDAEEIAKNAAKFDAAIQPALDYISALHNERSSESLEAIDKKLFENKTAAAEIAFKLWGKWLSGKTVSVSPNLKERMLRYVTAVKLAGGAALSPDVEKDFHSLSKELTQYMQCWAVTSLSAKSSVPFEKGLFDYVIIDEASQCDIASILPLLYRAKRAVIIGDPMQLSHISQISREQDQALLKKYGVGFEWSYSQNSLYKIAASKVESGDIVQLRDHFRSCADIIEFSNEHFYDGSLRTATRYDQLKTPAGEKPGIRWIDVKGKAVRPNNGSAYNAEEVQAVVAELSRLVDTGYRGTIGVTTPFRRQAEEIRSALERNAPKLYQKLQNNHEFIADTVHKFQGDERDVMLFSPVAANGLSASSQSFLSSTGNLFNVAITRARAELIVIGDFSYCKNCNVSYLKQFADYYDKLNSGQKRVMTEVQYSNSRKYPVVANPDQVSDWEKMFYTKLYDAGIQTIPQYPADKYKLDLAILKDNNRKLDIEVDGEMYHRQWNGELSYRDQLRNQRLFELGWDVKRFWVSQLRDDLPWCIEQIKKWYEG